MQTKLNNPSNQNVLISKKDSLEIYTTLNKTIKQLTKQKLIQNYERALKKSKAPRLLTNENIFKKYKFMSDTLQQINISQDYFFLNLYISLLRITLIEKISQIKQKNHYQ